MFYQPRMIKSLTIFASAIILLVASVTIMMYKSESYTLVTGQLQASNETKPLRIATSHQSSESNITTTNIHQGSAGFLGILPQFITLLVISLGLFTMFPVLKCVKRPCGLLEYSLAKLKFVMNALLSSVFTSALSLLLSLVAGNWFLIAVALILLAASFSLYIYSSNQLRKIILREMRQV